MKKFEGMLFCTDLDGTLYRDDKTISRENLEAIEYFKAEGGAFTFITGRVPKTSKHIYEAIRPNAPFGCFNGGAIYSHLEEKYLWSRQVDESAIELVRAVDKAFPDMGIQYNTASEVIFCKNNLATHHFRQATGMPNLCRSYEEITEPVIKIVFADTEIPQIEALAKMLNAHPLA
ncbi:MAG: HAD family phosphatase, partial [Clostridia bacterium]|nr:HAD family phosphatase [Clostridia bacterium]